VRWCFIRNEEGVGASLRALSRRWPIFALVLIGVVLLILGGSVGEGSEEGTVGDYMAEAEEYRAELEQDLAALCSQIRGVGEVSAVMITLEGGEEYVWAENSGSGGTSSVVISNKQGLLVERRMPEVRGVSLVCTGGGSDTVKKELTDAISAALGVPSSRIRICEGR